MAVSPPTSSFGVSSDFKASFLQLAVEVTLSEEGLCICLHPWGTEAWRLRSGDSQQATAFPWNVWSPGSSEATDGGHQRPPVGHRKGQPCAWAEQPCPEQLGLPAGAASEQVPELSGPFHLVGHQLPQLLSLLVREFERAVSRSAWKVARAWHGLSAR